MIEFASEDIRTKFNELSLDEQRRYNDWALELIDTEQFLFITGVETWDDGVSVSCDIRHITAAKN